jgi:hypothetical protein
MLPLVILAFCATAPFFRLAKQNGVHPGKAAALPFYCLGIAMIASHVGAMLIGSGLSRMSVAAANADRIVAMYNLFLLCLYIAMLRKNWRAIEAVGRSRKQV